MNWLLCKLVRLFTDKHTIELPSKKLNIQEIAFPLNFAVAYTNECYGSKIFLCLIPKYYWKGVERDIEEVISHENLHTVINNMNLPVESTMLDNMFGAIGDIEFYLEYGETFKSIRRKIKPKKKRHYL